ncbi:MAG: hypothetical protein AB7S78_09890 [Candidatus Omnitrophota bacterium]
MRKVIIFLTVVCLGIEFFYILKQPAETETSKVSVTAGSQTVMMIPEKILKIEDRYAPVEDKIVRKQLTYEAVDSETNNTIDKTIVYITEQPGGNKFVQWFLIKKDFPLVEEYLLNEQWETLQWQSSLSTAGTLYTGGKQGKTLVLKGKFKNKDFSKTIVLKDDLPFYYNPKLGLKGFVLSGQNKIEFWGFRTDELTEFRMKAQKKGIHQITLNGETFDALKVYWAATGLGEQFFNRTYYFRLSDGEFISQDPADKWKMKLIQLETTLVPEDAYRVDHL